MISISYRRLVPRLPSCYTRLIYDQQKLILRALSTHHVITASSSSAPVELNALDIPPKNTTSSSCPMVMCHGLLGSSTNWRGIAQKFALNRHVISVDLRNHGSSPHTDDMSYESMAADIFHLMDKKHIDGIIGMGHSLGGKVMMSAALLYPHRFKAVIIVDMAPYNYGQQQQSWSGVAGVVHSLNKVDFSHVKSRDDVDSQLRPLITTSSTRSFVLQNVVHSQSPPPAFTWRLNLPVITQSLPSLSSFPVKESLRYEGPTLFVRGELSDFVRDEQYACMKQYFPDYELVTIKDANHWVHADQPKAFTEAIQKFLHKHKL